MSAPTVQCGALSVSLGHRHLLISSRDIRSYLSTSREVHEIYYCVLTATVRAGIQGLFADSFDVDSGSLSAVNIHCTSAASVRLVHHLSVLTASD